MTFLMALGFVSLAVVCTSMRYGTWVDVFIVIAAMQVLVP